MSFVWGQREAMPPLLVRGPYYESDSDDSGEEDKEEQGQQEEDEDEEAT